MKQLEGFLKSVGAENFIIENNLIRINNKRFTASTELQNAILRKDRLVYAGRLVGKTRNIWEPSSILLRELATLPTTHKAWVDNAAAWLFVCGRDIFQERINRINPQFTEGMNYLVMMDEECLGYGRLQWFNDKLILINVFDLGDFLRREKWREE